MIRPDSGFTFGLLLAAIAAPRPRGRGVMKRWSPSRNCRHRAGLFLAQGMDGAGYFLKCR